MPEIPEHNQDIAIAERIMGAARRLCTPDARNVAVARAKMKDAFVQALLAGFRNTRLDLCCHCRGEGGPCLISA